MQLADTSERKDLWIGIALLLLGFTARWLYVLALDIPSPIRGDAISYYYYAKNLLTYGVFSLDRQGVPVPDSYWAPGYPFFLAFCFKLADLLRVNFYPVVLFLQAWLGGGIVFFAYHLGRTFLSAKAAITAAVLIILSPHLNTHGGYFLSETLFAFWMIAALYFYRIALRSSGSIYWGIAGGVFGVSYLVNPVILFLPFLLSIIYLFNHYVKASWQPLKKAALFLAIFVIFVAGWGLRSFMNVPAERASSSQRAFENLVIGAHKEYHDIWYANATAFDPSMKVVNPADVDMRLYKDDHPAFYRELAHRIANEPTAYLHWYFIQKPLDLWGWKILVGDGDVYVFPVNSSIYHSSKIALVSLVIMKQLHFWLFGLALLGLLFALGDPKSRTALLSVYALLIYTSAVFVVLHADARYSVPMRPEMYLAAVYAAERLHRYIKSRREQSQASLVGG